MNPAVRENYDRLLMIDERGETRVAASWFGAPPRVIAASPARDGKPDRDLLFVTRAVLNTPPVTRV